MRWSFSLFLVAAFVLSSCGQATIPVVQPWDQGGTGFQVMLDYAPITQAGETILRVTIKNISGKNLRLFGDGAEPLGNYQSSRGEKGEIWYQLCLMQPDGKKFFLNNYVQTNLDGGMMVDLKPDQQINGEYRLSPEDIHRVGKRPVVAEVVFSESGKSKIFGAFSNSIELPNMSR